LKEVWLWRCSEGRVGSYAFKASLLLLAFPKITYSTYFTMKKIKYKNCLHMYFHSHIIKVIH